MLAVYLQCYLGLEVELPSTSKGLFIFCYLTVYSAFSLLQNIKKKKIMSVGGTLSQLPIKLVYVCGVCWYGSG